MSRIPPPALNVPEIEAMVRFVAREAPHLMIALVWLIVTNKDAVAVLREAHHLGDPSHLAELSTADEIFQAAVQLSEPARRRVPPGQARTESAMTRTSVESVARWVHRVATTQRRLLPAALSQICRRPPVRLTLRGYKFQPGEILALSALAFRPQTPKERRLMMEEQSVAQAALTSLAVDLDALRGRYEQIRQDLDHGAWPAEIDAGDAPPSLEYQMVSNLSTVIEEYLRPATALTRVTAALTAECVERSWQASRAKALAAELHRSLTKMCEGVESISKVFEALRAEVPDIDLTVIRRTSEALAESTAAINTLVARGFADDEGAGFST